MKNSGLTMLSGVGSQALHQVPGLYTILFGMIFLVLEKLSFPLAGPRQKDYKSRISALKAQSPQEGRAAPRLRVRGRIHRGLLCHPRGEGGADCAPGPGTGHLAAWAQNGVGRSKALV